MAAAADGHAAADPLPNAPAPPNSQTPGHPSFRRQRASRACETCHSRKVRCDAASLGVPCTNCVAFSIECKIPTPKRKKAQKKGKESDSEPDDAAADDAEPPEVFPDKGPEQWGLSRTSLDTTTNKGVNAWTDPEIFSRAAENAQPNQFMKPKFARAPIKEAGRVAYLGESSNLSLLVHDRHGASDVVHYPLPEAIKGSRSRLTELDNIEIDILHQRGAFLLPPRALCDELVDAFFQWVAPVVPVINRNAFMLRYRDSKNPPSLLLLQAILLAGSRVCTNAQLMDANGSTSPAAMTFYRRAKALYDANYEDDRVTIVQALVLMGWYWESPEDVTKNVFYWTRVATVVAQGSGMHRSVENSQLSRPDKRLWKRIWWTLFTRDRSVAVALGRPVQINVEDSDVEMVCEDDFVEDEDEGLMKYPSDPVHVQFFLQYVRLCEIMGLVLSQQYSVASKEKRQNAIDLTHSDMALADWLHNCPKEVYWEKQRHHFWSALLHSNYYTTLCLLHRAHMPPATYHESLSKANGYPIDAAYPSRNIAFQAAGMITAIIEALQIHDQLRYTPAFIVYCLFSALIMHVYQMRSSVPSVVTATQNRLQICMDALKEVSKVWNVARMVHKLFESILGNKVLEDKLQKAAGKRHKKSRREAATEAAAEEQSPTRMAKRKFEELDTAFTNPPAPAANISYERSRPQTPSITASHEAGNSNLAPSASMPAPSMSGPLRQQNDAFMGTSISRGNTRPTTPFNASYAIPATPPDLFLVTRDSPRISQSLWENFQPDQLFPDSTNLNFGYAGTQPNLDPQLQMPPDQPANILQTPLLGAQHIPTRMVHSSPDAGQSEMQNSTADIPGMSQTPGMQQQNMAQQGRPNLYTGDAHSPDDSWSNSSRGAVPTTLNMEEWVQFFGFNGDMNGMSMDTLSDLR